MHWASLDELLEADHRSRLVWAAVAGLRLDDWLAEIKAVEGNVGRDATDPRLLVALWVYATLEGVGSARELARLCEKHLAYQWLCGGVTVNHHLLADFRSQGGEKWDALLTQIVASLLAEGLVTMTRVAQDGMRVRASAGKASFRRRVRLESCLEEARQQVQALKQLAEESPEELSQRQRAARQRAACERAERIAEAIRNCEQLQAEREERAKIACEPAKEARASTTDPEARNMKFANGGYNPGYNVQFSTETAGGVIVGVAVTNVGNDGGELLPMLEQIEERYGCGPGEALVDGGFATKEAIRDAAENHACTVYAPLKDEEKQRAKGTDPHAPKKGDSVAVAAWRARMGTDAAKAIYRLRCKTAEWVNALARNRGLWQMQVRGQRKCRTVAVMYAIAHNLMQALRLRAEALKTSG
jgi:transposase